ncbi:hypothetical protein Bca4012_074950 [Brassica carinata]
MESRRRNVAGDPKTISKPLDAEEFSSMIPIELTIEIFSRLPLKSIARCRCVSKHWASILLRPDFTDLFFTKSLARPKLLFALPKESEFLFFSSPQPRENTSLPITVDHHVSVHHIASPLNGFFCISYDRILKESETITRKKQRVTVICNPSTRQSFTLPKVLLALKTVLLLYRRRLEDLLYSFAESQSLDCLSLRSCGLPLASHLVAESEFAMVERLVDRKTESQEELLVRVATSREEFRHLKSFDYVVVNAKGRLDDAVSRVEAIIDAEKSRVHQRVKEVWNLSWLCFSRELRFYSG